MNRELLRKRNAARDMLIALLAGPALLGLLIIGAAVWRAFS